VFNRTRVISVALILAIACILAGCSTRTAAAPPPTTPSATSTSAPKQATTAPLGKRFAVTPTDVTVNQPVTFSGSGCPVGDRVVASIGRSSVAHGTQARALPHPDGSWTTTVAVDDSTQVGDRDAAAACVDEESGRAIFRYPPLDVQVTTYRHLYVAPDTTVQPGTTLTAIPTAPCPQGPPAGALIDLHRPDVNAFNKPTVDDSAVIDLNGAGNWAGHLTVPDNSAPGSYVLDAICVGPNQTLNAWYESVPITVTERTGSH
jgi:hypothetical protein